MWDTSTASRGVSSSPFHSYHELTSFSTLERRERIVRTGGKVVRESLMRPIVGSLTSSQKDERSDEKQPSNIDRNASGDTTKLSKAIRTLASQESKASKAI